MTTTPTAPISTPVPPAQHSWSGGRTLLIIVGALSVLFSLVLFAIGGIGLWAHQHRDGDGYFRAGPERVTTGSFAVTVPSLAVDGVGPDAFYTDDFLGTVRIDLESRNAGVPLFIGIGPSDQVAKYLSGVGHDEVSDLEVDPFRPTYTARSGGRPAATPASQTFWAASDTGTGARSLTWKATGGDWAIVIMNADGSPAVDVDLSVGGTLPAIQGITIAAFIAGGLLLLIGAAVIVLTATTRKASAGA
jgi:hypothetical protein